MSTFDAFQVPVGLGPVEADPHGGAELAGLEPGDAGIAADDLAAGLGDELRAAQESAAAVDDLDPDAPTLSLDVSDGPVVPPAVGSGGGGW